MAPMPYAEARRLGPTEAARLSRASCRALVAGARRRGPRPGRGPRPTGAACHLYRESMNPVMTARFMRSGRLAHRSPHLDKLYLAGSSTHPGQWVSFCAISGVLAADRVLEDLR